MRHTKIIATVGPASASREMLGALVEAGVDVFRLNFSHGTHASHAEMLCAHSGHHRRPRAGTVGIMQDLSGPKIRTGPLAGDRPLPLKVGDALVLAAGNAPSQPGRIFTPYAELVRSAKPGDRLLLDDGRIELQSRRRVPRRGWIWWSFMAASSARTRASTRRASRCRHRRSPTRTSRTCASA